MSENFHKIQDTLEKAKFPETDNALNALSLLKNSPDGCFTSSISSTDQILKQCPLAITNENIKITLAEAITAEPSDIPGNLVGGMIAGLSNPEFYNFLKSLGDAGVSGASKFGQLISKFLQEPTDNEQHRELAIQGILKHSTPALQNAIERYEHRPHGNEDFATWLKHSSHEQLHYDMQRLQWDVVSDFVPPVQRPERPPGTPPNKPDDDDWEELPLPPPKPSK